jgi:hypothetical protein
VHIIIHRTFGEQDKILTQTPPIFVVRLEKLLTGSIVHPVKEVHIDGLVLREKIVDIFFLGLDAKSAGGQSSEQLIEGLSVDPLLSPVPFNNGNTFKSLRLVVGGKPPQTSKVL